MTSGVKKASRALAKALANDAKAIEAMKATERDTALVDLLVEVTGGIGAIVGLADATRLLTFARERVACAYESLRQAEKRARRKVKS